MLGDPALARVLLVTPAVYPHLVDFTRKLNVRFKSGLTHGTESQNHAENIPVGLTSSQSIFEANRSRGS